MTYNTQPQVEPLKAIICLLLLTILSLTTSSCFTIDPGTAFPTNFQKIEAKWQGVGRESRFTPGHFKTVEISRQSENTFRMRGDRFVSCSPGRPRRGRNLCVFPIRTATIDGKQLQLLKKFISRIPKKVCSLGEDPRRMCTPGHITTITVDGKGLSDFSSDCCGDLVGDYQERFGAAVDYINKLVAEQPLAPMPSWVKDEPDSCVVRSKSCSPSQCSAADGKTTADLAVRELEDGIEHTLAELLVEYTHVDDEKAKARVTSWLEPMDKFVGRSATHCTSDKHGIRCRAHQLACVNPDQLIERVEKQNLDERDRKRIINRLEQYYDE